MDEGTSLKIFNKPFCLLIETAVAAIKMNDKSPQITYYSIII